MAIDQDDILAESENLLVWRSAEEVGFVYHIELGSLSLHFLPEEWEEFVTVISQASSS